MVRISFFSNVAATSLLEFCVLRVIYCPILMDCKDACKYRPDHSVVPLNVHIVCVCVNYIAHAGLPNLGGAYAAKIMPECTEYQQ